MKALILFPVIAMAGFSSLIPVHSTPVNMTDTVIINHVLDGNASEWPTGEFETDKETGILYAADNDAQNLFIVMKLPGIPTQVKVMREGMTLYVDMKGKKKKGKGIEFPVKKDLGSSSGNFGNNGNRGQGFDINTLKTRYALNMLGLKLFGFTDGEPAEQGLQIEGSANITFNWDSLNVLHIEYAIPLIMLEEKIPSLDHKEISLGWKIGNAMAAGPSGSGAPTSTRITRPGAGSVNTRAASETTSMNNASEEQSFWTKFTFMIPAK